jgi:peptide/nickel transport system permease protein
MPATAALLARRILWLIPTLFGLVLLTFVIAHVIPSDPAGLVAGDTATPAQIAAIRTRLGLDQSLPRQFADYLRALAHGDLGQSLFTGRPITQDLLVRLPITLELTFYAMLLAILGGVPLGVLAGRRHRTMVDHAIRVGTVAGFAIASFWLALMLQLVFAMDLRWLPLSGRSTGGALGLTGIATLDALLTGQPAAFLDGLRHVALPAIALALPVMATLVRFARAGILEALASPALVYQRAMGVPSRVRVWRYAMRHTLIAVVTQAGLSFGVMLAGSVVIETIFDWPGVGNYAYNSITHSDYPAVMGFVLWSGVSFMFVNFAIDLLLAAIDPRARAA